MSVNRKVTPNSEQVAAKIMDGEAVLINLATGMYYSMADAATDIWNWIEEGRSVDEMAAALAGKYDVEVTQAHSDVERLVADLEQENLVVVTDAAAAADVPCPAAGGENLTYQVPSLEKFTDMAEMFALDPPLPGIVDAKTANG